MGKIVLTEDEVKFIKANHSLMSNKEMAQHLGYKLTTFRVLVYDLGLKRMELEYWTTEMLQFLKDNYKTMGDTAIAQYFQIHYPKNKPWTHHHIEKKRGYNNLKRTPAEIESIKRNNVLNGSGKKNHWRMKEENVYENGTVLTWRQNNRQMLVIKVKGKFIPLAPHLYALVHGEVPKGFVVSFADNNHLNCTIENLVLKTRADIAVENGWHTKIPEDMREVFWLYTKLNKEIKRLQPQTQRMQPKTNNN